MKTALCIGINDYPGTGSDLAGCVNDANDWALVLSNSGFTVKKLLDNQATKANIVSRIKELIISAVDDRDSIVIQYSGHGTQVPDLNRDEPDKLDEALCNYDLSTEGPLLDDELWQLFKLKKPGVKLVFISDSCHSGSVIRAMGSTASGTKKFLPYGNWSKNIKPVKRMLNGNSFPECDDDSKSPWPCLLMSGCQDNEYSYDASFKGRANGAFSYFALQEFKKLSEKATYQEWFDLIRRRLPTIEHPQTPNLTGSFKKENVFSNRKA
jgi:hypothetical protein